MACALNAVHLKGARLTAPPFSEETIIMLSTGWSYNELMNTPVEIIEELKVYWHVVSEYQAQREAESA